MPRACADLLSAAWNWAAGSIIFTLSAAAVLVVLYLRWKTPKSPPWGFVAVMLSVIVVAVAVAIWTGANSVNDREQPLVSLQPEADELGLTTITIDVRRQACSRATGWSYRSSG